MSPRTWKAAVLGALSLGLMVGLASATPSPDGVVVIERVFNDCPLSTFTSVNNYPAEIDFSDVGNNCYGWANLHVWRFADGGVPAVFNNNSAFRFSATLVVDGNGQGESGLQISPWWSQNVDGRVNIRTTDGEIACWGGRLPFYSYTATDGLHYVKGQPIGIEMTYLPNGLSSVSPATIQYKIVYGGVTYLSPVLPFDEGNPAEGYGTWGMLNDGRVGGHLQPLWSLGGDPFATVTAVWTDVTFQNLDQVGTEQTTWGGVKDLYK